MLSQIRASGLMSAVMMIAFAAAPATAGANGEGITESTLPAGSSDLFRERMMDWAKAVESPAARTSDRPDVPRRVRNERLRISSPFGWRSDPINGVVRHHEGIDLPALFGSPVMATGAGVVRIARWVRGYGNLVEIEHPGGVRTRYGHLSRLDVYPSEHVRQGQQVGEVGSMGHSTGPHVHYEVRVYGRPVDPLHYIGQQAPANGAQAYQTAWGPKLSATPRWVGWADPQERDSLPRSQIR